MSFEVQHPQDKGMLRKTLSSFRRKCDGVLCSIVLDREGILVQQDADEFVDMDTESLIDSLIDIYLALDQMSEKQTRSSSRNSKKLDVILNFDGILIYCRPIVAGALIVLAEPDTSVMRIRSLSNLLIRKIDRKTLEGE